MKINKFNFLIALFSILAIASFSFTISTDEAMSIREADYDKDGILDEDDACPLSSETFNKFEDSDGCPDSVSEETTQYQFPDSDDDGIEDRLDECVDIPENFDGYLDLDGCPEIIPDKLNGETDSDLDGITDSFDICPLDKETFNDFQDADGCPDSYAPSSGGTTDSSLAYTECGFGKALIQRNNSQNTDCISTDTAKKWERYGIAKIISESVPKETSQVLPQVQDTVESEPMVDSPVYPNDTSKELEPVEESSISLETATSKMERLFELHRTQLQTTWDSLSNIEKSDLVQMLDKMYDMMQSMDFREHMKQMSMMDGKHDYKDDKHGCTCDEAGVCTCGEMGMHEGCTCGPDGCSCGEGEHGCSCGEGEHGAVCELGEGCSCSDDGVCTCGENCLCASCS